MDIVRHETWRDGAPQGARRVGTREDHYRSPPERDYKKLQIIRRSLESVVPGQFGTGEKSKGRFAGLPQINAASDFSAPEIRDRSAGMRQDGDENGPVRECRHAVGGKSRWHEDASTPGEPRFVGSRIHGKYFDALAATVIDDMKSG
jgi:hypothetical protein